MGILHIDNYPKLVYNLNIPDTGRMEVKIVVNYKFPNIEAERARYSMSQEDLAEKLDVERKTYYNWLTSGNIPVRYLIRLSDIFDCSVDYLLGRTMNPMRS